MQSDYDTSLLAEDATSFVTAPIGNLAATDEEAPPAEPSPKLHDVPLIASSAASVGSLSVLTVPTDEHYSPGTGMVQCVVYERPNNKYVLSFQLDNGIEIPVLLAEKQKTMKVLPKYHIFDISGHGDTSGNFDKDSEQYLGKIRRDKNLRIHGFSLTPPEGSAESKNQVLYILYELPSLTSVIMRREPPRRAQIALYDEASDINGLGNRLSHMVNASLKATKHLDQVASPESGLYAFPNKEPYKKANGDLALNFNNRCRRANAANMQIEGDNGEVLLQTAKWDKGTFNVDFRAPFNAFQAFAFTVAQICDY